MLSREDAEHYGQISGAEVGLSRLSGGKKFADEFFDPKTQPVRAGRAHRPAGNPVSSPARSRTCRRAFRPSTRSARMSSWPGSEKARPLAKKAADRLAEQLKKQGGPPKDATLQGYRS